ncbi:MAG: hypothetical protein C0514_03900 [Candidatus Puniceispirillum sp.]|nr:hypothetical protein [Candidatus Puniceispirillum sp.]
MRLPTVVGKTKEAGSPVMRARTGASAWALEIARLPLTAPPKGSCGPPVKGFVTKSGESVMRPLALQGTCLFSHMVGMVYAMEQARARASGGTMICFNVRCWFVTMASRQKKARRRHKKREAGMFHNQAPYRCETGVSFKTCAEFVPFPRCRQEKRGASRCGSITKKLTL